MSDPDQIIKLASNENPLGPSPKAIEAMRCALAIRAALFPMAAALFARGTGRPPWFGRENIILGNGSNEVIEFLGHAFLKPDRPAESKLAGIRSHQAAPTRSSISARRAGGPPCVSRESKTLSCQLPSRSHSRPFHKVASRKEQLCWHVQLNA
jgi:hypothetical protein